MDYKTAVRLAINNDQDGWDYLYTSTYKGLYFCAKLILKNEEDVEDVLQNSYMQAYSKLHTLEDPEKFPAWMKKIVVNASIRYKDKNKKMFHFSFDNEDDGISIYDIEDDNKTFHPESALDKTDTKRLLRELIDSLPYEQRQTLLLFHYENMSQEEIAGYFKCSVNTVKSRLLYARRKLRDNLSQMKKKGYAIGGAAAVPFLVYLLDKEKNSAEITQAAKLSMEATAPIVESSASVSSFYSVVHTIAVRNIVYKLAAGLVSIGIISGGYYGISQLHRNVRQIEEPIVDEKQIHEEQIDEKLIHKEQINEEQINIDKKTIETNNETINEPIFNRYIASSSLIPKSENTSESQVEVSDYPYDSSHNCSVTNLIFNNDACWSEGVSGVGMGEYIDVSSDSYQEVSGCWIMNGCILSYSKFKNNGRVTKVKFKIDDGREFDVDLDSESYGKIQYCEFPEKVQTQNIRIIIADAIPGKKYDNTCISYVYPGDKNTYLNKSIRYHKNIKTPEYSSIKNSSGSYMDSDYSRYKRVDLSYETPAWIEEVDGVETGEYIEFNSTELEPINGCAVNNGYVYYSEIGGLSLEWNEEYHEFLDYGRVTKLSIECFDDEHSIFTFDLDPNSGDTQYLNFNKTVLTKKIKIIIDDSMPGIKYDITCVNNLVPYYSYDDDKIFLKCKEITNNE